MSNRLMGFLGLFKRVALALLLISILAMTYYVGFKRGEASTANRTAGVIRSGGFVASFDSLQSLRGGDFTNGVRRLEDYCYSSAADLLGSTSPSRTIVSQLFRDDLIEYRKKYARPPGTRTPTETRLDTLLAETR